jgi:hypothetical protein
VLPGQLPGGACWPVQAGNCGAADQLAMQHIAAADDAVGLQGRGSEVDGLSAGGFTGQGYVYDLRTGSTVPATSSAIRKAR